MVLECMPFLFCKNFFFFLCMPGLGHGFVHRVARSVFCSKMHFFGAGTELAQVKTSRTIRCTRSVAAFDEYPLLVYMTVFLRDGFGLSFPERSRNVTDALEPHGIEVSSPSPPLPR